MKLKLNDLFLEWREEGLWPALKNLDRLEDGRRALRLLFNEVLRRMPAWEADRLRKEYSNGKTIVLVLGRSGWGDDKRPHFAWALTEDQSWRNKPFEGGVQWPETMPRVQ